MSATAAGHPSTGPTRGKRLIWSDEFTGIAGGLPDPSKWSFDTGGGGWGNRELQYYTPASSGNAILDGHGHLKIIARKGRYTGPDGVSSNYTSGRLQTLHTFEFTYGLVQARIEVPEGAGLLPTFWALGSDAYDGPGSWPGSGEIDAMEVRGAEPQVLYGTVHGPWTWLPGGLGGELHVKAPLSRKFHTYAVEWSPTSVAFLLDGRVYRTVRPSQLRPGSPWPFQHPFFLLLNLTVGGKFGGDPRASTRFPASMDVDWVRVWQ
jgi:beta-glucanase (GH16 family)